MVFVCVCSPFALCNLFRMITLLKCCVVVCVLSVCVVVLCVSVLLALCDVWCVPCACVCFLFEVFVLLCSGVLFLFMYVFRCVFVSYASRLWLFSCCFVYDRYLFFIVSRPPCLLFGVSFFRVGNVCMLVCCVCALVVCFCLSG